MVRLLFLFAFAISLSFESFRIANITSSMLFAICYVLSCGTLLTKSFDVLNKYRKPLGSALVFLIVLCVSNAIHCDNQSLIYLFPSSIVSCFLLMIVLMIHVSEDSRAVNAFLLGFVVGIIGLSVCFFLGIGVEIAEYTFRMTIFGMNANNTGFLICVAFCIVFYQFILNNTYRIGPVRYLSFIPLAGMVSVLLATASRSAFILLTIIVVISLFYSNNDAKYKKIGYLILTSFVIAFYFINYADYDVLFNRLLDSIDERGDSARTDRWRYFFPHVFDNFIIGIGQTGYSQLCKSYFGSTDIYGYASLHNVFLEIFLYTGLLGGFYMMRFLYYVAKSSFESFKINKSLINILLLAPIFMMFITGQALVFKMVWCLFGIVLCSPNIQSKQSLH